MWTVLLTLAGTVISAGIGLFNGSHRSPIGRRIRFHADLLKVVEGNKEASASLEALIAAEAEELKDREVMRLRRIINPPGIAVALIITGVAAVIFYYVVQWSISTAAEWWHFVTVIVAVLVGALLLALAYASFVAIWQERK